MSGTFKSVKAKFISKSLLKISVTPIHGNEPKIEPSGTPEIGTVFDLLLFTKTYCFLYYILLQQVFNRI